METKLTIRELAPYLPYRVHLMNEYGRWHNTTLTKALSVYDMLLMKPILRPLSDLTKEIEHNGEKFIPINLMNEYSDLRCVPSFTSSDPDNLYFSITEDKVYLTDILPNHINRLFEWHFDIFGLIENNLAIDKNSLTATTPHNNKNE